MKFDLSIKKNKAWDIISKSCVVVLLFFGIFMPCIIRFRIQYIMLFIGVVYILFLVPLNRSFYINKTLISMICCFIPFYVYYTILIISKGALNTSGGISLYLTEYIQAFSIALYVIVLAIALGLRDHCNEISSDKFFQLIIYVSDLQLFFVVLSFIFLSIKTFFNNLTTNNSFSDSIRASMKSEWDMTWRAYGLTENYYDGFGFVISILLSSVLVYGFKHKSKFIIALAFIMLVMPLLNARTGLVLCVVSYSIILLRYLNVKRAVRYIILLLFGVIVFMLLFKRLPYGLQDALTRGISDIGLLFKGQRVGVFSEILDADFRFPEDMFFGAGASPERIAHIIGVDSGLVQGVWRFGVIGSILLWLGFLSCGYIAYQNNKHKSDRIIVITLFVLMFMYYFKLYFFNSYANVFIIFFVLFVVAIGNNKTEVSSHS